MRTRYARMVGAALAALLALPAAASSLITGAVVYDGSIGALKPRKGTR